MYFSRKKTVFKPLIFLGLLLISLSFSSCSNNPVIEEVNDIELVSIEEDVLNVRMTFKMRNKYSVGIKLKNSNFKLRYGSKTIGDFQLDDDMYLSKKETTDVEVSAQIDIKKLSENLRSMMKKDSIQFNLRGTGDLKVLGIGSTVLMENEFYFNYYSMLAKIIDQKFQDNNPTELLNLSLAEESSLLTPVIQYDYKIYNEHGVDISINSIDMNFRLKENASPFAQWSHRETLVLKSLRDETLPVKVKVSAAQLGLSVLGSGIFGGSSDKEPMGTDILIDGTIHLQIQDHKFKLPVKYHKAIDLSAITDLL